MKKKAIFASVLCSIILYGCGGASTGISQEEYDKIVAERDELQAKLEMYESGSAYEEYQPEDNNVIEEDTKEYNIGDTWTVDGQWSVTVNSVEETQERNQYSDKTPAAVYIVTYTYENIGYKDEYGDGLFISLEDSIVDNSGKMGYSYPGDITMYAQETPIGATCEAQVCIGVDNAGSFKIYFEKYDSNSNSHEAIFNVEL